VQRENVRGEGCLMERALEEEGVRRDVEEREGVS